MAVPNNANRTDETKSPATRSAATTFRDIIVCIVGAAVLVIGVGIWNTRDKVTQLDVKVATLETDVCGIKGSKSDAANVQNSLISQQNDISALKGEVNGLSRETAQLTQIANSEVPTMEHISELRERVAALEAIIELQAKEGASARPDAITLR